MDVWTPEFLRKLEFDSNRELFDHLRIEALKSGFVLCSRYALIEPYGKFYCSKGRQTEKSTNKCRCGFSFCSTPIQKGEKYVYQIRIDYSLNLQHENHTPNPRIYSHILMPDDLKEQIRILANSGIKPTQIQKYLFNMDVDFYSTLQIQTITEKEKINSFNIESEDLINYIESKDGFQRAYEIPTEDGSSRVAVLTINKEEFANLENFGDVLFIDGTHSNLKLKWEIFPITAITKDCNICCCGILYAATANEEILLWLLNTLSEFPEFANKIKTLITDEDHAFTSAYKAWIKGINTNDGHFIIHHVLCALHKTKNFIKKLDKVGLNKHDKDEAKEKFKILCYNPNLDYSKKALDILANNYGPRICKYVEKHVIPFLSNFARAYISDVHCINYNTTSPAESMNHMLKQAFDHKQLTLVESRVEFDRILANHSVNCLIKNEKMRSLPLFTNCECISGALLKKILIEIKISNKIVIVQNEQNSFNAFHEKYPSVVYELTKDSCSCGLCSFAGYPCSHIIKLYNMNEQGFPIHLIDERWLIKAIDQKEFTDLICSVNNSDDEEEENEDDHLDGDDENNQDDYSSEKARYIKLFHKGKELAKLGSRDPKTSKNILKVLQSQINEILQIPAESFNQSIENIDDLDNGSHQIESNHTITDAPGTPKGAPKKRGRNPKPTNMVDHMKKNNCEICTLNHKTSECKFYQKRIDLLKKNKELYKNSDGRHCSLCAGINHQNRHCPLREEALEFYRQKI